MDKRLFNILRNATDAPLASSSVEWAPIMQNRTDSVSFPKAASGEPTILLSAENGRTIYSTE
eukprot:2540242-Pleurochrysis_carterae.AAC.1